MIEPVELSEASIERIAQRLAQLQAPARGPLDARRLDVAGAMAMLGFGTSNRKRFWELVRELGIPYERLSPHRCLFRVSDIDAILRQRQVGDLPRRAGAVAIYGGHAA
jgi:hypothetical protein